jgi:hypothetical protein
LFQHGQWRCASETKPSSDTGSVGRISFVEVFDPQLLNMLRHRFHAGHDVADQALAGPGAIKRKRLPGCVY